MLLHDIPEVRLNSFMDAVLPSLPSNELKSVYEVLIENGDVKLSDTDNPGWKFFQPEDEIPQFLERVTNAIILSHMTEAAESVTLGIAGQTVPINALRPNTFFYINDPSLQTVEWADIVMPIEFKNEYNEEAKLENFAKVTESMYRIMRSDARRRFAYGLTCENTKARLWYNDRSDIVASEEFDLNKASAMEIPCYDPSMVSVFADDGNSEPRYDITIYNAEKQTNRTYRTIRMISHAGVDSAVGRGTRVWAVREVMDGHLVGPLYALKDVWVHEDRIKEHGLLKKIREDQAEYSQYFLTPVDHGFTPFDPSMPSIPDNTHKTLRRQVLELTGKVLCIRPVTACHTKGNRGQKAPGASTDSVGRFEGITHSTWQGHWSIARLSKHPRLHYRIVFEEIGEPVHNLRNFTDIFTAIQGGWEGLHAIHLSGYVHRDVSSGNVLLVPPSGSLGKRGVIMDLEYAKVVDDESAPHDVRIGTADFMATEVSAMEHHRLDTLRAARERILSREEQKRRIQSPQHQMLPPEIPLPPFRHNPLHDMESIWWLCIWMVFYLVPSKGNPETIQPQYDDYRKTFGSPQIKQQFFCRSSIFSQLTKHLSGTTLFLSPMKSWLTRLNGLYSTIYEELDTSTTPLTIIQIDTEAIGFSYVSGKRFLSQLEDLAKSISTKFVTLSERHNGPHSAMTPPRVVFDGVYPPPPERQRIAVDQCD
ncbi:unnamed protein product [Rhizoctonia solani]|uniref:Fungal-type protein kinase domain-containing protein n=1 Tax=Rhizoctonia solani TaxID=456999 RepID=A0A8H3AWA9_9AGAM|nr:unnamed protein product [Rhizoctonia solani]